MSVSYVTVQWNKRKWVYDAFLLAFVALYVATFTMLAQSTWAGPQRINPQIVSMRAWGSCAYLMLTAILSIGPLARLDRRFLPVLYNRRHFGVLMAVVAMVHANQVLSYYQSYGRLSKLEALFTFDTQLTEASWPFQLFGAGALAILVVMALSSHDFWQKCFGPTVWKWLHMGVYLAFALAVAHVSFGEMQWETHPLAAGLVLFSAVWVGGLHCAAALNDGGGVPEKSSDDTHWLDAGEPDSLSANRARRVDTPEGERIAIVRSGDSVSAIHGVCAHQGGPLYEGKVIDGCLTCPWHGWQYRPEDGQSPPPFTEKIPTYRMKLEGGRLWVDPTPLPAGTAVTPVRIGAADD